VLLGDAEDPELAVLPGAMLLQQEGQQHEETSIVNDPPNVDVAFDLKTSHRKRQMKSLDANVKC
jgi:hypothetical protein